MTAKSSLPYSSLITFSVLGLLILASGCQSGAFSKPDFGKLAFWKKQDAVLPPPPARHVDPARFEGEAEKELESQIAGNQNVGESVRERLEIARSGLTSRGNDGSAMDASQATEENKFDLNLSKIRSSMEDAANRENTRLTGAQEDFKSAMDSAANQFGGGTSSDGDNGFEVTPTVYDASGKLVKQSKNQAADFARKALAKAQSSANDFQDSVSNSMKAGVSQVRNQFDASRDRLESATQERFDGVSKAADAVKNPFPKFDASKFSISEKQLKEAMPNQELQQLQAELTKGKQEIQALREQVAAKKRLAEQNMLQPESSTAKLAPMNQLGPSGGSFEPAPKPVGDMALAPSTPKTSTSDANSFSPGGALSNLQPMAGSSSFDGSSTSSSASSSSDTIYGSLQPIQKEASAGSAKPKSGQDSMYPSTPHKGFSKSNDPGVKMPQSGVAQVGVLQPIEGGSGRVAQAEALLPMGASQNSAGRIQSFVPSPTSQVVNTVGEVDIPASVLTGKGSYAPGSVSTLKR